MEIAPRISVDNSTQLGRPVITGTRVPVEVVLARLGAGMTYEQLAAEYALTREDILAALDFASRILADQEVTAAG